MGLRVALAVVVMRDRIDRPALVLVRLPRTVPVPPPRTLGVHNCSWFTHATPSLALSQRVCRGPDTSARGDREYASDRDPIVTTYANATGGPYFMLPPGLPVLGPVKSWSSVSASKTTCGIPGPPPTLPTK